MREAVGSPAIPKGLPLEWDECVRLDTFIARIGHERDLEFADGLFCALGVVPGPVEPEQWVRPILGGAPEVPSEEAATIRHLLLRHCFDVVSRLRLSSDELDQDSFYLPLITERSRPEGPAVGERWARGFFTGMAASGVDWTPLQHDAEGMRLLMPIAMLFQGYDPEAPEQTLDRRKLIDLLPVLVYGMRHWWVASGHALRVARERRNAPQAGRNEPCPCGSGRKFKKCCGAARTTLH